MRLERSFLFVPGEDEETLEAALATDVDVVILDLEDTVAPEDKDRARERVTALLADPPTDDVRWYVRVNGLDSPRGLEDVAAIAAAEAHPFGLLLPDVRDATEPRMAADVLDASAARTGLAPIVERPEAAFRALEIARSTPRIHAMTFGSVDFRRRMGLSTLDDTGDVTVPRYRVAMAAHAAGAKAFDTVYVDRENEAGLVAEARSAKAVGYTGKMAIAPTQVGPINEIFSPSPAEIDRAQRLIKAFEAQNAGVIFFEGTFVDKPVVNQQRALIERGVKAGLSLDG